jgi:hypothetical protein
VLRDGMMVTFGEPNEILKPVAQGPAQPAAAPAAARAEPAQAGALAGIGAAQNPPRQRISLAAPKAPTATAAE